MRPNEYNRSMRAALFLLLATSVFAQAPHDSWRTIETEHYRIHFPAPWEEWARQAGSHLEASWPRVVEAIGYEPRQITDVLVMDPVASANGSAWPLLGAPRMILWTNPPPPESTIGANRDWIETLSVHESVHLVHILRPSRNPLQQLGNIILPLGPLARTPRWVTEGYATLLEGELTGTGRPNSDFRATVLRRWAQLGKLPSYPQLNSDRRSFLGMSMAYLAGSAYLEWLREREGDRSLRDLWARATARQGRSFDAAFRGVYGDSPADLYARFRAELTAKALSIEHEMQPQLQDGELWQDFVWSTDAPSVSPSGDRIVTVRRSRDNPSKIVVLSTEPPVEEEKKFSERLQKILERDPDDVAPVRRRPLPREPKATLHAINGAEPYTPRWMPDGKSILYFQFEPDQDGFLHPDLFLWHLDQDRVERLTELADLRRADPSPDGSQIVAVRNRYGRSQLVLLDLASKSIWELTENDIDTIYDSPRFSPDGRHLAFVRQSGGSWTLLRCSIEAQCRDPLSLGLPAEALPATPAWAADGSHLYAAVGIDGFFEIWKVPADGSPASAIVRSHGGAFAPAPSPDGSALYFLSIDADGLDLRKLDLSEARELPRLRRDSGLFPLVRPDPVSVPLLDRVDLGPARKYGFGRPELTTLLGGHSTPSADSFHAGFRLGDVLGRLDLVGTAAAGDETGASLGAVTRRWPVELGVHAFSFEHDGTDQSGCGAAAACSDPAFDLERRGLELSASWTRRLSRTIRADAGGGLLAQQWTASELPQADEQSLFATARSVWSPSRGKLKAWMGAGLAVGAGSTGDEDWTRLRGGASAEVRYGGWSLGVSGERGTAGGDPTIYDRFALGGISGSLLPRGALLSRVLSPALPVAVAVGDEFESLRLSGSVPGIPLRLFVEEHRVWNEGGNRGDPVEVYGAEARARLQNMPVLRLPSLEFFAGGARREGGPLDEDDVFWIGLSWRP